MNMGWLLLAFALGLNILAGIGVVPEIDYAGYLAIGWIMGQIRADNEKHRK